MIKSVRGPLGIGLISLAAVVGAGCKKEQDSLVVVSVKADDMASNVTVLTIAAEGTSQTFSVAPNGLSSTATLFGLYVPSDVTGTVKVSAIASRGTCDGYTGQGTTNVAQAGTTSSPAAMIQLKPADLCTGDGGVGGQPGAAGTSGAAGASATGGAPGSGGVVGTAAAPGTGGTPRNGRGAGDGAALRGHRRRAGDGWWDGHPARRAGNRLLGDAAGRARRRR